MLFTIRQADEQYLGVAPYLAKLQAITSGAQYRAETGTTTSGAAYNQSGDPAFLQNAYKNALPSASGVSAPAAGPQGKTPAGTTPPSTQTLDPYPTG